MSEAGPSRCRKILSFAAAMEVGTGVGLMAAPSLVVALLLGVQTTDPMVLGRCLGVALLALGLACWPERRRPEPSAAALRAMFTYNGLIALFLGYVGVALHLGGLLLWPAAALHGVVALLLLWTRRDRRRDT